MKIINYSVSRRNPICSSKNEKEIGELGTESHLSARNESGVRGEQVSIPYCSLQQSF